MLVPWLKSFVSTDFERHTWEWTHKQILESFKLARLWGLTYIQVICKCLGYYPWLKITRYPWIQSAHSGGWLSLNCFLSNQTSWMQVHTKCPATKTSHMAKWLNFDDSWWTLSNLRNNFPEFPYELFEQAYSATNQHILKKTHWGSLHQEVHEDTKWVPSCP